MIKYKPVGTRTHIIIHSSFTKPTEDIGRYELDRKHRLQCKFDVGYHSIIKRDGTVELGRPFERVGAHTPDHDKLSLGICMIGGKSEKGKAVNNFTVKQFESLLIVVKEYSAACEMAIVVGHSIIDRSTTCPHFSVPAWLKKNELEHLTTAKKLEAFKNKT